MQSEDSQSACKLFGSNFPFEQKWSFFPPFLLLFGHLDSYYAWELVAFVARADIQYSSVVYLIHVDIFGFTLVSF